MDVSVVVPAYNEAGRLQETLDSIDGAVELIVVAGGDDGTLEVARNHPAVSMVIEDRESDGPAKARNLGARAAAGDVVAFTDADTEVGDDWVARHASHYDSPDVVGVGGPLRPKSTAVKHRLLFKLLSDYWYRVSWPFGFVQQSGNNCSFRRDAFLEEDGYDEDIGFMEDTELSLRMKRHGRVVYDPDAWVETAVRRQRDEGYLGLFLTYAKAYFDYYVRGKDPGDHYF